MTSSFPALASLLVVATGVAIGSWSDAPRLDPPQRVGDYWLLTGDFHVHGFLGDGSLPPSALRDEAARAGVHVIALTNHNQTFSARFGARPAGAGTPDWPLVLVGQEVTNPGYHLIGVGLSSTVDASLPVGDAIDAIHRQGGLAIGAHPVRAFRGWTDEAIARLDGVEVAHPTMYTRPEDRADLQAFFARAQDLNPDVAAIGSSDVHQMPTMALCRTLILARQPTREGVLDAIRAGRTVAMDGGGRLYGRPALIAMLPSRLPRRREDGRLVPRTAATVALAGVCALVMAGRRRPA